MIKKYVLKNKDFDLYSPNSLGIEKNRTPVLTVENDTLKFQNNTYELNGLKLDDWLLKNKEELKHTISNYSKNGSKEIFTYNEDMILEEVPLGDNEDFYVFYKKSEQDFKKDLQQLNNILSELTIIFKYIEPDIQNNKTYGLLLRDLIIRTCTEVETHWKELMRLNGYQKLNLNTNDYVKLLEFINFDHELKLVDYPLYLSIRPFSEWNKSNPSKSIKWYQTYNELKHDRTNNLSKANLCMLINSVSALYILMSIRYNLEGNSTNLNIISVFKSLKSIKGSKWRLNPLFHSFSIKSKFYKYFENKTFANSA